MTSWLGREESRGLSKRRIKDMTNTAQTTPGERFKANNELYVEIDRGTTHDSEIAPWR